MGRFDEAITIYEELLVAGKSVQKYLQKITSILSVLHDDKRLVRILKLVSAYLPWDETTLWNKIGDLLMRAKDYLGASEAFRKVISFDADDPTIQFNLALAYQELKLFKKAEETYRMVLELNPEDHAALNNLGNVLKEMKRYDESIEAYQIAIDIEPEKAISWANLGILYEELKLKNEAKECYQKAKEIAIKNKDYKTAAKFEEWENSI
jgi:tetratricopeptide (TPR) repeat protein